MEFLKSLFANESLTFAQFVEKVTGANIKLANLSDGQYVSLEKYNSNIDQYKQQLAQRDSDIANIKKDLEKAKTDSAELPKVQSTLTELQAKYEKDKNDFSAKIAHQDYVYGIKEKANSFKFSSESAKKAFVSDAIEKNFSFKDGKSSEFDSFVEDYKKNDPNAFVTEKPNNNNPQFTSYMHKNDSQGNENPFSFSFAQVHPSNNK